MADAVPGGSDRDDALGAVARWCACRPVELCVVFGSRARRDHRPSSDLDLALWPAHRTLPAALERLSWHDELSRAAGLEVQLTFVTPRLDPVLGMEIARDGQAVIETRPALWPAQRLRLWQLFQDSQPFLAVARRSLQTYAEEVSRGA